MRGVIISILKIAGFYALWAAGITGAILTVVHFGGPDWPKDVGWKFLAELGGTVAVFLALCIMALGVDRRPASTLGLSLRALPVGLIAGTLIGAAIFCVPVGILMALGYAHYAPDFSHFDPMMLGGLLAIVFVNVIDQELLVRSYPFQEIWRKYSATAAVVISTIIFLALHAAVFTKGTNGYLSGANVALASIMLGIAYVRSGALWLPIGIHFGWNGLQGPVLGINVTGMDLGGSWHAIGVNGPDLWTGGTMGIEGGLAGLAGPIIGLAIVMLWRQRSADREIESPDESGAPFQIERPRF